MEKSVNGAEGRSTESRALVRCVKKKKRKKDLELLRRQVLEAKRNLRNEAASSKVQKTSLTRALNYFADQRQENDKKTHGVDSTGKKVGKRKICTKLLPTNEQRIGIFAKGSKGDRIKRGNQHLNEENRARLRGDIHKLMNGNNANSISPAHSPDLGPPAEGSKSPILGNINRPKRYTRGDDLQTKKHTKRSDFQNMENEDLPTAKSPPPRTQKDNRYKRRLFEDDVDGNFGKEDRFFVEELRFSPKITPKAISMTSGTPERNASNTEIINDDSEKTKMPFCALRNINWSPTSRYERLCTSICPEKFENCFEEIEYTDPLKKARRTLMGIYADSCRQHLLRQRSNANNGLENSTTSSSFSETEDQVDVSEDTGALSSAEDSDEFSGPERKHERKDGKKNDSLAGLRAKSTNHTQRRLYQIVESRNVDHSKEWFDLLDGNEGRGFKSCKRKARRIFEEDSHKDDDELPMASLRVNIDAKSWNSADRSKSDIISFRNISDVVEREAFMIKFLEGLNMNKAKKDTLRLSPQEGCWSPSQAGKSSGERSLDESISRQRNIMEFAKLPGILKLGNFQNASEFEDLPGKMHFPKTMKHVPAILRRSNSRKSTERANISDSLFPFRVDIEKAIKTVPQDKDPLYKNKYGMEAAPSFAVPETEDLFQKRMTTDICFSDFETHQQTPSIVNAHLEQKNRLMRSKVNFMNAKYRTVSRDIGKENGNHGHSRKKERNCVRRTKCAFDPTTMKGMVLQQSSKDSAHVPARNKSISAFQEKYVREFDSHDEVNRTQNCAKTVRFLQRESGESAEGCAVRQRAAIKVARNEVRNWEAANLQRHDARDFGNFTELVRESCTHASKISDNILGENEKQSCGLRSENDGKETHSYVSQNVRAQSGLQKLVTTSSLDNEDSRNPSNFHPCKTSEGLLRVVAFENQSDNYGRGELVHGAQQAANLCEDVQPAKYLAFDNSQSTQRVPIYIRNDNVDLPSESSSANHVNFTKNQQVEHNASKSVEHKIVILPRHNENRILYAQDMQAPRSLLKNAPGRAVQHSEVTCLRCPVAAADNLYGQTATLKESCQSGAHRILQNVQIIEPLFQNKERNHCYPGVVYEEGGRMVASFMAEPIGIKKNIENSGKQFQNACQLQNGQNSEGQSHYAACVDSLEQPNRSKRIQLPDGRVGILLPKNNSQPNMSQRHRSAANYGVVYTGQNGNFELVIDPAYRHDEHTRNQTDGSCDHLYQRIVQPVYNIIEAHPSQVSANYFPTSF